jgi:hypothetical protein
MYRIVKRIVHTVTTVTWLVRLEDHAAEGRTIEKEITFPASYSVTEEEVLNTKNAPQPTSEVESEPRQLPDPEISESTSATTVLEVKEVDPPESQTIVHPPAEELPDDPKYYPFKKGNETS